jgi:hypothetical protein
MQFLMRQLQARFCLMFDQFPQQWVWNWKLKRWTMRKKGFAVGRMYYALTTSGERKDPIL